MAQQQQKRKVVIDTDCGVDDAVAISMALKHPSIDVIAITCVAGNTSLPDVLRNVATVLEFNHRQDIPFFKGAAKPLLGTWNPPHWPGHGTDGLGDISGAPEFKAPHIKPQSEHAVHALSRLAAEHAGELNIIALGPLTNIALTTALDPTFAVKVARLHIMGGTHRHQGNVALLAEFNILQDPEAAQMVLESPFHNLSLATYCMTQPMAMTWEWYRTHIVAGKTSMARFVRQITGPYAAMETIEAHAETSKFNMCDAAAMAAFLEPSFITDQQLLFGTIELHGAQTRGATLFDWSKLMPNRKPNVHLIKEFDRTKFEQIWLDLLEFDL